MATKQAKKKPKPATAKPAKKSVAVSPAPLTGMMDKSGVYATHATLALTKIHVLKDFNPRSEIGDVSGLTASIKQLKLTIPLVVRPRKGLPEGHYSLVDGHRRLASLKQADRKDASVIIRTDLESDVDALAVSLACGGDGQEPISPVDLGLGFKRFMKESGAKDAAEVARRTGNNYKFVSRHLELANAPIMIQEKVTSGTLSVSSALEYTSLPEETREKIKDKITDDMSKVQVRALAKEAVKEDGAVQDHTKEHKGPIAAGESAGARVASLVAWKGAKLLQEQIVKMCHMYLHIEVDEDPMFFAGALACLFWQRGNIDAIGDFTDIYRKSGDTYIVVETPGDSATKLEREAYKRQLAMIRAEAEKYVEKMEMSQAT